jgi:hypothetical protein
VFSRRATRVSRRGWIFAAVVLAAAAAGCGTQGLVLQQPTQIENLRPELYSNVKVPFTVSWDDARPLRRGERYMVFVDRNPMAPDESIRSLTDDTCKATPGCPDKAYLNQNFIFPTKGTSIEIAVLPFQGSVPVHDLYDLHKATVVIVDADDARVGEEFWTTSFYVNREV